MKIPLRVTGLLVALVLLEVTSACGGESKPDTPSLSTTTPPSVELNDSGLAAADATAILGRYYRVRDELRRSPSLSLKRLRTVAVSTELSTQTNLFGQERKKDWRQEGDTKIVELKVQSVSLDNSDPDKGVVPTVEIDLCFDVSGVDIVDRSGKSVISGDRPEFGWVRYSVSNYSWSDSKRSGWRVASSQDIKGEPCSVG